MASDRLTQVENINRKIRLEIARILHISTAIYRFLEADKFPCMIQLLP